MTDHREETEKLLDNLDAKGGLNEVALLSIITLQLSNILNRMDAEKNEDD